MSATAVKSRRRSFPGDFSARPAAPPPTPWLVAATDLGLLAALWLVPLCLGGRSPLGHGVLVVAALWATACWTLHQLYAADRKWIWTRSEWLWAAAIGLVCLQLAELPPEWLESLSPKHQQLLTEWTDDTPGEVLNARWNRLSLAPEETRSGLATFVAYGLLFLIAVQRCRELADVQRLLKWIAVATVAVAVFSLVQYWFGNGKFFGVIQHPFSNPQRYNTGPFTNRNQFAHFLTLGVGPLLWWWLTLAKPPETKEAGSQFGGAPGARGTFFAQLLCLAALSVVVLAILLSLSRSGLLGLALTGMFSLWGLQRARLVSAQVVLGLFATGVVIGGLGWASGSQELVQRLDATGPDGRWQIWQANAEIVRDFPWLGTGVGSHINSHQLYLDRNYDRHEYTHADNSYIQVASECGWVGLGIAALMLWTCGGWVAGVLRRNTDPATTAVAAAIFGGVMGHSVHAVFDFVWYAPGCMVVAVLLAAAGRRVSQLDLVATGWQTPELPLPRLCWAVAGSGLVLLAPWLWAQKADAIAAEPHRLRFLNLVFVPWEVFPLDEQPETQIALQRAKASSAVQAAKANPRDSRIQLAASLSYRQMFDLLQERSDNPMSVAQLRDAVQASGSGFESAEQVRDWIRRATGKNAKLLDASWNCGLRSVTTAPLEGQGYVYLAELSFLHDPSGELQSRLLKQALIVRPYDPHVLFAAGQQAILQNREADGIALWQRAFRYAPSFQQRIADVLAIEKSAEFFLETFHPDWEAQGRIADALRAQGRTEELHVLLANLAESAAAFAREQTDEALAEPAWLAARAAWWELNQPRQAIAMLQAAVRQNPHSLALRTALGTDLFRQEQYAAAATHLRWATHHNPEDVALQDLAKQAIRGELQAGSARAANVTPAVFDERR